MRAIGMKPRRPSADVIEAQVPFRDVVNAFTRQPILAAIVRNFGADRVVCSSPRHLAHLPGIKLDAITDLAGYEEELLRLYDRRLDKLQDVSDYLRAMKIPAELDEPGFRLVSRVTIGRDEVTFTVREGRIVQLLTVAGRDLDSLCDARDRRVEAKHARSRAELEMVLDPLVARMRDLFTQPTRGNNASPFAGELEDEPTKKVKIEPEREMFDFDFAGELSDSGLPREPTRTITRSDDTGALLARVCDSCRAFYVAPAKLPPGSGLLARCPRCL